MLLLQYYGTFCLVFGRLNGTAGFKASCKWRSDPIFCVFWGYIHGHFASKGQPTPYGLLLSLTGTRRIKVRRSFEGNDA